MGQHFVYFCFVVFLAALGFFASNLNTRPLNLDTTNSRTHYKNLLPPVRFKPPAPRQGALPPWLECEGGRERKRLAFPKNHKSNTKVTLGSDPVSREKVTQKFVRTIDEDFDFVMLTEYFDESLVLLKRLMCWTIRDIVYFKSTNVRNCPHEEVQLPPDLQQAHKEWSFVDYALYDHFNKSFWRRINSSGNDYWGEDQEVPGSNPTHVTDLVSSLRGKGLTSGTVLDDLRVSKNVDLLQARTVLDTSTRLGLSDENRPGAYGSG
ncbi:hypothetical protein Bbelb_052620 [Branchiostoma belcheri]|nr:hypothetical protein Bbelb_052620 [Branchiostoma belcheri]